jgi:hypothetical protein
MLETFLISFRLRNTYRVNTILHGLQALPLVGRLIPNKLYASRFLLTLVNTLSGIGEFFSVFLGKAIYLGVLYYLATKVYPGNSADIFLHLCLLLTVTGGVLNTALFNPSRDKYYAIVLMRMDARRYTLTDYYYFLLKILVGFLPFSLLFGHLSGLPLWLCALLPLYVCGVKLCAAAIMLHFSGGTHQVKNENAPNAAAKITLFVSLLLAVIPPVFSFYLPRTAAFVLMALAVLLGIFSLGRVHRFSDYRRVYKGLLRPEAFAAGDDSAAKMAQQGLQKKIITDTSITSSKTGYAYFNELFMKRHAKILTRSAKRIAIILAVVVVGLGVATTLVGTVRNVVSTMVLRDLPIFLWIMYFINRGQQITRAMFMNCDHSMLTYRFFRQKDAILLLFRQRLRDVVAINLLPASVLAVGLPVLLWLSGGTDNALNYAVLFVSILAMSVFFSVHAMVLYYLLQPFNLELESKNIAYTLANTITYAICYVFIRAEIPTLLFGACTVAFCLIYVVLSLVLAYRLAPKSFRLR